MNDGSTSRRTLVSGSLMSRSTMTSTTSVSMNNNSSNPVMIANRYCVGKKIGFGNFGEVRVGRDINSGVNVAIKLESMKVRIPQLKGEHRFYLLLGRGEGIPTVYYYGPFYSHNALVLEFLGPNLEQLFMKCGRKFLYKSVLLIAMQLVRRFEYIHSKGIIFRDVKPENFVIGNGTKEGTIYIIDFGLSKPYINWETKQHIPFCDHKNLSGTARYMSVNTHFGYEQSRRDDLEALGYMFIYFLRGALPWQGLKVDNLFERYHKIGLMKSTTPVDTLCYNLANEWVQYLNHVKQLRFDQKPDYDFLYNIFFNACQKNDYAVDNQFEWTNQAYICSMAINHRLSAHNKDKGVNDSFLFNHEDYVGAWDPDIALYNSYSTPGKNYQPVPNVVDGILNENLYGHAHPNPNIGPVTPTSNNRATCTILNDMKKNQQTRSEKFKSHSRKPTPSHFGTDKKYCKKKYIKNGTTSDVGYQPGNAGSSENNASFGRIGNLKDSIWNCCYKFKRSNRVSDG